MQSHDHHALTFHDFLFAAKRHALIDAAVAWSCERCGVRFAAMKMDAAGERIVDTPASRLTVEDAMTLIAAAEHVREAATRGIYFFDAARDRRSVADHEREHTDMPLRVEYHSGGIWGDRVITKIRNLAVAFDLDATAFALYDCAELWPELRENVAQRGDWCNECNYVENRLRAILSLHLDQPTLTVRMILGLEDAPPAAAQPTPVKRRAKRNRGHDEAQAEIYLRDHPDATAAEVGEHAFDVKCSDRHVKKLTAWIRRSSNSAKPLTPEQELQRLHREQLRDDAQTRVHRQIIRA